jgi:hypothetical protein
MEMARRRWRRRGGSGDGEAAVETARRLTSSSTATGVIVDGGWRHRRRRLASSSTAAGVVVDGSWRRRRRWLLVVDGDDVSWLTTATTSAG